MVFNVSLRKVLNCTIDRAFRTPMLCDVTKIHTGFGLMPKITHVQDDDNWGKPGFSKRIFADKSWTFRGGEVSSDTVLSRIENVQWKIQVADFKSWMLGFTKFIGEWNVRELESNKIEVIYAYHLSANVWYLFPLNWLFTNLFWRIYMSRVLRNIEILILNEEPYLYP